MNWIEIIELRSAAVTDIINQLPLDELYKEAADPKPKQLFIMKSSTISTDISILLIIESNEMKPYGSKFGMELIALLSEYGLISHKVWHLEQVMEIDQ